jgi:dienelactone hydrolase
MRYVGLLMTLMALHVSDAVAGHLVQFDAFAFEKTSTKKLLGYLAKPDGPGPFPAVVVLHGGTGFFSGTSVAADRLSSWGYVALAVDSLRPRDRDNACSSGSRDQPIDAYAALNYLAAQTFVDPDRIGTLGFSMGGGSALTAVERGIIEEAFPRKFRAVIAYYPLCATKSILTAPTLILIGEVEDWAPAQACQELAKGADKNGAAINVVVYPNAYHGFDLPGLRQGQRLFGHWIEYDEAAAADALKQTRQFLEANLVVRERQ